MCANKIPAQNTAPTPPFTEPQPTPGPREHTLSVFWDIGAPDPEGWQLQARIEVHALPGHGHHAILRLVRVQGPFWIEDYGITETLTITKRTGSAKPVPVDPDRLATAYRSALTEVRRRYDARDHVVIAYFRPAPAPAD